MIRGKNELVISIITLGDVPRIQKFLVTFVDE